MTTDTDADDAASAQIDTYLASLPEDMGTALQGLRRTIQAAAPEAVEAISYGARPFGTVGARSSRSGRRSITARSTS